jgi:drug/metabolite transporter (DMT)-like permease
MALSRAKAGWILVFLVLMWGVNWPLTKYALNFTPPLLFAGMRLLIGGLVLGLYALPRYKTLQLRKTWHIYAISAVFNIIFFYGFQTVGLTKVPAGLFSSIVFLQPVLLGIGAWLWLGETMYGMKITGLVLGFAGTAVISLGGMTGQISPEGVILGLFSALSWAAGTIYMKKNSTKVDGLWMTAIPILVGGIVLTAAGTASESWGNVQWGLSFITDMLFISVFVIALGWLAFFKLVSNGEASKVGSFTFLIPLIALLCSVLFLGESVTVNLVAGLIMIIASILLVNLKPKGNKMVNM